MGKENRSASGRTWSTRELRRFVETAESEDLQQDTKIAQDWFRFCRENKGSDASVVGCRYVDQRIGDDESRGIVSRLILKSDEDGRIDDYDTIVSSVVTTNSGASRWESMCATELVREDPDGYLIFDITNIGKYARYMGFEIPKEWEVE